MWLVDKLHGGTETLREPVPRAAHEALLRWYTGIGSDEDHRDSVRLVSNAKMFERWLACDCLGAANAPPLLSPAYMSEAGTYYLRRLTGTTRPEHLGSCPFHRDQAEYTAEREQLYPSCSRPTGFFAVLKPVRERLAQQPEADESPEVLRPATIPRLARLLWTLLEAAQTNVVEPIGQRQRPSINYEFSRIRAAAQSLWLAPGLPLRKLLFTHPEDFHSHRVYAQLRRTMAAWPPCHEPQAFLLVYAAAISQHEIGFTRHPPIGVLNPITRPPVSAIADGPIVVLVAIGHDRRARGLAAVRAHAQPIVSGQHFMPIASSAERKLHLLLLDLQWSLHARGYSCRLSQPLFDVDTAQGPCRPGILADVANSHGGKQHHSQLVLLPDTPKAPGLEAAIASRRRMIAPIINIRASATALPSNLSAWLAGQLTANPGF